jgi:proteasome lid subunit RPN8/RPN11
MNDLDDLFGTPSVVAHRPRSGYLDNPRYLVVELRGQKVFIRRDALARLLRTGRRHAERRSVEVGFLCLGRRERDAAGAYTAIEHFALVGVGTATRVEMPAEAKIAAQRARASLDVVGWAHTHPDFGVFFSGTDLENCAHYGESAVNLVYDPIRGELGFFEGTAHRRTLRVARRTRRAADAPPTSLGTRVRALWDSLWTHAPRPDRDCHEGSPRGVCTVDGRAVLRGRSGDHPRDGECGTLGLRCAARPRSPSAASAPSPAAAG